MHKDEFINRMVGVPYVNRAYSFDECDCFGLVYLYFKHVADIDITLTDEYLDFNEFTDSFNAQLSSGEWCKVDSPSGGDVVFMMYNGDIPMHCGVMISSVGCLHAMGDPNTNTGQVVVWKLSQVKRYLKSKLRMNGSPRVEFYKWQS